MENLKFEKISIEDQVESWKQEYAFLDFLITRPGQIVRYNDEPQLYILEDCILEYSNETI